MRHGAPGALRAPSTGVLVFLPEEQTFRRNRLSSVFWLVPPQRPVTQDHDAGL